MGKMEEIHKLFQEGKTVKEIIELGYKKPTVYKVNKESENTKPDKDINNDNPADNLDNNSNLDKELSTDSLDKNQGNEKENGSENTENLNESENEPENKHDNILEGIKEEIFEDDESTPFREFNEVGIIRDDVDISHGANIHQDIKVSKDPKTGKIGVTELFTEVFGTIGILTGHDFWELSTKDQKVLKHLCRLPGLEKFLHKFGLYGCALGLFTIVFKRIKLEIKFKKSDIPAKEEQIESEKPGCKTVMDGFTP